MPLRVQKPNPSCGQLLLYFPCSYPSMASSLNSLLLLAALLFLSFLPSSTAGSLNTTAAAADAVVVQDLCRSTPYPVACLDSLKLSISISINPSILSLALHSLQVSIAEVTKLSPLLVSAGSAGALVESQRGSLQDCQDLHRITLASLSRSAELVDPAAGGGPRKFADARTYLAAALTDRATCLEGLAGARGPAKAGLVESWKAAYAHVSNSLSLVTRSAGRPKGRGLSARRGFPGWLGRRGRRLLQDGDYGESSPGLTVTVAADGTGNFTTVGDAVAWAPSNYDDHVIILVRAGVYSENVQVTSDKTNIVLLGDGSDVTIITGSRSVADGWTTFGTATVAVSGRGFLARDITFQNTAGPAKGQAVALRVNADLVALYRCAIEGYQDTLFVHSFRQFYRECDVSGTIDFVFGNAAAVLQGCNLLARLPLPGQANAITAQSRDDPNEATGISIQHCSILAADDLAAAGATVSTYLGRPWQPYSTVAYIGSFMDTLVDPAGWLEWPGGQGLDTLYYGEYMNTGPGADTSRRVNWPGFHLMDYDEAATFSVSELILGNQWLDSTSFPYDSDI